MVLRILRLTRHAGWLALLGACATVSACSNNPPPVPQAFIAATVGVGPMSNSRVCNFATLQQWLEVGTGGGYVVHASIVLLAIGFSGGLR